MTAASPVEQEAEPGPQRRRHPRRPVGGDDDVDGHAREHRLRLVGTGAEDHHDPVAAALVERGGRPQEPGGPVRIAHQRLGPPEAAALPCSQQHPDDRHLSLRTPGRVPRPGDRDRRGRATVPSAPTATPYDAPAAGRGSHDRRRGWSQTRSQPRRGPRLPSLLVARAVDDVGPGQVAHRRREHVHQPGERPQREQADRPASACSWNPSGASAISVGSGWKARMPRNQSETPSR